DGSATNTACSGGSEKVPSLCSSTPPAASPEQTSRTYRSSRPAAAAISDGVPLAFPSHASSPERSATARRAIVVVPAAIPTKRSRNASTLAGSTLGLSTGVSGDDGAGHDSGSGTV